MALIAMEMTGFLNEETTIMGDRLYTDVACVVNGGILTIFAIQVRVLADAENSDVKPDFVYDNIRKLYNDFFALS